jgi:hypothetical protein
MSYLHCPTCQRAYNVAVQSACPYCPVAATAVDATEDIVAAAELLARAMARATPAERSSAASRLDHIALPPPDAVLPPFAPSLDTSQRLSTVLRQIRVAIAPPPVPPVARPVLASFAVAVLARLESRPLLRGMIARVKALTA